MIAAGAVELHSRSERALVKRAALAALDDLRRSSGGYLARLEAYAGQFTAGEVDEVMARMLGQAPAILVAAGDSDYDTKALNRRRAVVALDLHVIVVSRHLGSFEARLEGEENGEIASGDPGIDVMLAEVRERLMGADLGLPGVEPPIAVAEEEVFTAPEGAAFRITFRVRCAVALDPAAGSPRRPVSLVEHRSNLADSAEVNPVTVGETSG